MGAKFSGYAVRKETISAANPQPGALSIEITGPDPGLLIGVSINTVNGPVVDEPEVSGIAVDGNPATLVRARVGTYLWLYVFEFAAPTVGTSSVQVTLSAIGAGTAEVIIVALAYHYAKQASVTDAQFADTAGDGTNAAATLNYGDVDDLRISFVATREDHGMIAVHLERQRTVQGSGAEMVKCGNSEREGGTGSMTWNVGIGGAYDEWAMIVVPVMWSEIPQPSPTSAASPKRRHYVNAAMSGLSSRFARAQTWPSRLLYIR